MVVVIAARGAGEHHHGDASRQTGQHVVGHAAGEDHEPVNPAGHVPHGGAIGVVTSDPDHQHEALLPRLQLRTAQHLVEEQHRGVPAVVLRLLADDRERRRLAVGGGEGIERRGVLRGVEPGEGQSQHPCPPLSEAPGTAAGDVPQRGDGVEHAFASDRTHGVRRAQHPRDRGDRDAGPIGHVVHGRRLAHADAPPDRAARAAW